MGLSSYHNAVGSGEFVINDVAGVACAGGFKDEDFRFGVGHGAMLDAARDNTELAGLQLDGVVAKFDSHLSPPNEEQLVLVVVEVPGKDAGDFDQLEFLTVQLGDDFRPPLLVNQGKFFRQGGFVHVLPFTSSVPG